MTDDDLDRLEHKANPKDAPDGMAVFVPMLASELRELVAELRRLREDAALLDWMADDPPLDGLCDFDLYEFWHAVAVENGHEEATTEDKRTAFRRLLKAGMDAVSKD